MNGYSAEGFAFSTTAAGRLLYNLLPDLSFAPTRYSLDLQPIEGAGIFGLLLEVRGDPADYAGQAFYGVGLSTDGDLVMLVKGAAADLQLLTLAQGAAPNLTDGATVGLTVDRFADRLAIRVGDGEALNVAAPAPEGGTVGFFTRAEARMAARFDNLLLTSGPPGDGPPCATIRPLFDTADGADVAIVQRRLRHLGYAPGAASAYGAEAAGAVAEFQRRNGLAADGVVGPETWCALLSGAAVAAGDDRPEQALNADRYRPVRIDLAAELPAPLLVSVRGAAEQWRVALALPDRERLHYIDTGGETLDPAWLPDTGLLAFSGIRAGNDYEAIWIYDTRSGTVKQVSPPGLSSSFPAWSPDGRRLMFTVERNEDGRRQARNYVYSLESGRATEWSAEYAGWADWSPAGTVVFTGWTGRSFDLFAAGAEGGAAVNLTGTDDAHEDIAAWSPSGDRIAFVRNPRPEPNNRQIFIMQADGSEAQQVTALPGPNSNPIWLDNTTIVFAHQPSDTVRRPYLLRLPNDLRPLTASDERIWFMGRFEVE